MRSITAAVQEPLDRPAGQNAAAFCFQDLAEVSEARLKELHTQDWGEAPLLQSPL